MESWDRKAPNVRVVARRATMEGSLENMVTMERGSGEVPRRFARHCNTDALRDTNRTAVRRNLHRLPHVFEPLAESGGGLPASR
jgi:hypothetical protein